MIGLLGGLLRRALAADDRAEVELGEELADLETYVEIQRMRLGERLRFTTDVPPALESIEVPGLLLQPLVENAIRHGLPPEGGHVHVSAARENGALVLEVRDDGQGLRGPYLEGVGLGNLRARLGALYGAPARLDVRNAGPEGSGVRVRVHLPLDVPAARRGPPWRPRRA
jgi:LytS/YehU family sensor histidine kinase